MSTLTQSEVSRVDDEPPKIIPNVLNGTECGEIKSPDVSLIGRRVVHDEHFGTIHYVGELPGSAGFWLGVDWDNPSRGRHDGTYRGVQYFHTSTVTSGSFVRPEKVSLGTSLEEALVYRYVLCAECQLSASLNPSGTGSVDKDRADPRKTLFQPTDSPGRLSALMGASLDPDSLEYCGMSNESERPIRIELFTTPANSQDPAQHRSCGPQGAETALKYLRTVTFPLVPVYRALRGPPSPEMASLWPQLGGTLGHYLPNLSKLDLSGCLVSRWKEIAEIGIQLPWLKSLDLSSNHLRLPLLLASPSGDAEQTLRVKYDLDTHPSDEKLFSQAFPNVCCLVLVRSLFLDWPGLLRIIKWMPSLKSLTVAYNQLGNLPTNLDVDTVHAFHRLVELDLTATGTSELGYLFSILGPSTVLDTLLLGQNPIAAFPELPVSPEAVRSDDPFAPSIWFQALTTLNMRNTAFTNWHPIKQLLRLHRLEQLTFSDCPVLENLTIETARQELIARLPHVSCINRIQVCPDERRGAELDYLKRYGAVWRSSGGAPIDTGPGPVDDKNAITMSPDFAQEHPVFVKLCSKWGVPDDGESKLITRSLKEGLMNITFVLEDPDNKNVSPTLLSSQSPKFVNQKELTRRIPGRMTVGHLRMMVRRLFKIPAKSSFDLVAQGERHRKINTEVTLDSDTREFGFYCLEDGDKIYVRIHA
ncbi:hypothetical protein T265_05005 [Opisthorchis viverrini]|uniref:Tubulin-specific chaperone E n=1 Tax=Opisthorchis viverrini TaxID=6198 RepID=A0A074ZL65_OPIVI|nr:hypothetical protein T265_05005 [Opisthorchis viverrini]KER28093.1 hypothetical protein T265_05005 [Opisthorchis viverrini]